MIKKTICKNIKYIFGIFISSLFIIYSTSYIPYQLGICFQKIIDNKESTDYSALLILTVYYTIRAVFKLVRNHLAALMGNDVVMALRLDAVNSILSMSDYNSLDNTSCYSILSYDLNMISDIISWRTFVFLEDVFIIIFSVYTMAKINLLLALLLILSLIALLPVSFSYGKKIGSVICNLRDNISRISSLVYDNITAQKIIRTLNAQNSESSKFSRLNNENRKLHIEKATIDKSYTPIMNIFAYGIFLISIPIGSTFIIKETMDIGGLVTFSSYMWLLISTATNLSSIILFFINSKESLKRVFRFKECNFKNNSCDIKECIDDIDNIELKDINFKKKNKIILNKICLTMKKVKIYTIKGEIGSGKSSLMNILAGLESSYSGILKVNREIIRDKGSIQYKKHVGYVTQESIFFNNSFINNIRLYREEVSDEDYKRAIIISRLENVIENLKNKEETLINKDSNFLSGGERQRICLARALAGSPAILLIDDALNAIDKENQEAILNNIKKIKDKMIIVFVSNLDKIIDMSDFVYEVKDGKLIDFDRELLCLAKK